MKKVLILIIFILLSLVNNVFSNEVIIRVPDNEGAYPPFFVQNENGKWSGLSIELAEALLNEAGYQPVYRPLPFPRGLRYLESGEIHLMLNLSIKKERAVYTHFIGPQLDETVILVVPKNSNFKIKTLDDFKKLKRPIGIEINKYYGKKFGKKFNTDMIFKAKIEAVTDFTSNEKKLAAMRISGFLGYGYNVYYRFKTDPLYEKFTIYPITIQKDWVYYGLSKKSVSSDMLDRIQKAFDRAKKKGLFKKIKKHYRFYL